MLALTPGHELAVSADTMVEACTFSDMEPDSLGHKALAVNFPTSRHGSDPEWAMLALTVRRPTKPGSKVLRAGSSRLRRTTR